MRFVRPTRSASFCVLLSALALSPRAGAQDMELGMDLSEATVDLRPTLAVLGVDLTEGDPNKDGKLVGFIGAMLAGNAARTGLFASVMKPEEVAQALGDQYAGSLGCVEDACMVEIASALGVERVLGAQLAHGKATSTLKLNAFTRASLAVETTTVEVKGPPSSNFIKKTALALKPVYQLLSGKLAHLKVTPSESTARVSLGDRDLGTGTVSEKVSAGTYTLKVTADGHRPVEQQVELEEGGTADLGIALERAPKVTGADGAVAAGARRPPAEVQPASGKSPPAKPGSYFAHPGSYVAAAGVVSMLVGAGMGTSAMATQGRLVDANGDGVLEITRSGALAAQNQAMVANVLLAAGAVGLAGGGAWLLLAPPKGGGVGIAAGGRF